MKICFISDTHNYLADLDMPEADLLIHCGDATMSGTVDEFVKFNTDLGRIKYKYKNGIIFVAGNHDFLFYQDKELGQYILSNAVYLQDESIIIDGIVFYGTPWCPRYFDWAFMPESWKLAEYRNNIPKGIDVLISHSPALGILDDVGLRGGHAGCGYLLERVKYISPLIHASGHIHEGYGYQFFNGTHFINCAVLDGWYSLENDPILVEVNKITRTVTGEICNEKRIIL